jgi:hypothetical protein
MFPFLPVRDPGTAALGKLVAVMKARPSAQQGNHHVPAGYTYLAQFIDHDITFDAASSLRGNNDPDEVVNFRTPRFDLDSLYGSGPADQPYLYDCSPGPCAGAKLLVACHPAGSALARRDLPRNAQGRAIIGDPRNDEHRIISQLHLLFMRFHNRVVGVVHRKHRHLEGAALFERARQIVCWHYQWIVIHDFLPKIVGNDMANSVFPGAVPSASPPPVRRRPYCWPDEPFIPVEFSAAAFRFGHSMVRAEYFVNDPDVAIPILALDADAADDSHLSGLRPLPCSLEIKWKHFFAPLPLSEADFRTVNRSMKFDERLVEALHRLPIELTLGELPEPPGAAQPAPATTSLALLNLYRGRALGLPCGQDVARALGEEPLTDEQLFPHEMPEALGEALDALKDATPLWYYILREAAADIGGTRLGTVGGAVVAEVLVALLEGDPRSYVRSRPRWRPWLDACTPGTFTMIDLARFALGPDEADSAPRCPSESS